MLTYRSRIITQHRCPRQRFLEYHCRGNGIVLDKLGLAVSIGTAVHRGRAIILECGDIEKAIKIAIDEYSEEAKSKVLGVDVNEDQLFVYEESKALIEMMIWVWYYIGYPNLMSEYDVVEIQEGSSKPTDWGTFYDKKLIEPEILCKLSDNITLMSRPDSILRSKSTGGIYVDSFKTASYPTTAIYNEEGELVDKNKYDDQGISELIAVESLLGEEVEGIRMEFFIKGNRAKSAYTTSDGTSEKRKLQQTFLVHPYKFDAGLTVDYALKYSWIDDEGKNRKLGKGWKRVDIWNDTIELKDWVDYLLENYKAELEQLIIVPYPYNRSSEDVNNWKQQNIYQETKIDKSITNLQVYEPNLVGIRESSSDKYKELLNQWFPQRRESCYQFGRFCEYAPICWEGVQTTDSRYVARTPNHQEELVQLKKG